MTPLPFNEKCLILLCLKTRGQSISHGWTRMHTDKNQGLSYRCSSVADLSLPRCQERLILKPRPSRLKSAPHLGSEWTRCDRRRRPARGGGRSGRKCPRAAYGYTEAVPMDAIRISDFASEGVTLTPATAADFDDRAQAILGGNAAPLLELKPY